MTLFKRNSNSDEGEDQKKKGDWKRPANTAFKQQRLKAWQPILTPKTVLPTLFIIGILFAPIGGLLIWGSSQISQITLEYTGCEMAGANFSATAPGNFTDLPNFFYELKSGDDKRSFAKPQWSFLSDSGNSDPSKHMQCRLKFELPADFKHPVFVYYKLTNYYQNHRRYVQSLNADQLKGKAISASVLSSTSCKPLAVSSDNKPIYPCGLIANSVFNDTILNPVNTADNTTYTFSEKGIAWPGEKKKYSATTEYKLTEIVPPPNWSSRYPQNYTESNFPDLTQDEHFQNWMRTAGLPTFSKLYGRNDNDDLKAGTYTLDVYMNYPVQQFGGTKSVVISTVSWIGGKNPFLGWAYIASSALFVLLAVIGLVWHCIKPRKLGDMNLLSWNQAPR